MLCKIKNNILILKNLIKLKNRVDFSNLSILYSVILTYCLLDSIKYILININLSWNSIKIKDLIETFFKIKIRKDFTFCLKSKNQILIL